MDLVTALLIVGHVAVAALALAPIIVALGWSEVPGRVIPGWFRR